MICKLERMPFRILAFLGGCTLVVPISPSQTKARPHVTGSSTSTKSSNAATPVVEKLAYLNHPIDVATSNLGPSFAGHDIKSIIEALKNAPELKPKSEFESTPEYLQRRSAFSTKKLLSGLGVGDNYAFVVKPDDVLRGSVFKYDADARVLGLELIGQRETPYDNPSSYLNSLVLRDDTLSNEKYIGSNAMGAKVEVTKIFSMEYGLAFDSSSWLFSRSKDRLRPKFSSMLSIGPEDAARIKPNLEFVVVCRLVEPWIRNSGFTHDATIDDPYQMTTGKYFLQVSPVQLWLIDRQSGEVIRRFSQGGMQKEAEEQFGLRLKQHPLIVELQADKSVPIILVDITVDDQPMQKYQQVSPSESLVIDANRSVAIHWRLPGDVYALKVTVNGKSYAPNWQLEGIVAGHALDANTIITIPVQ
jgi:hypothetical protein